MKLTCEHSGIEFPSKDGWQKCSERMPDSNGTYLCCYIFDGTKFYHGYYFYAGNKTFETTKREGKRQMTAFESVYFALFGALFFCG
jgi:hypothetical protein